MNLCGSTRLAQGEDAPAVAATVSEYPTFFGLASDLSSFFLLRYFSGTSARRLHPIRSAPITFGLLGECLCSFLCFLYQTISPHLPRRCSVSSRRSSKSCFFPLKTPRLCGLYRSTRGRDMNDKPDVPTIAEARDHVILLSQSLPTIIDAGSFRTRSGTFVDQRRRQSLCPFEKHRHGESKSLPAQPTCWERGDLVAESPAPAICSKAALPSGTCWR